MQSSSELSIGNCSLRANKYRLRMHMISALNDAFASQEYLPITRCAGFVRGHVRRFILKSDFQNNVALLIGLQSAHTCFSNFVFLSFFAHDSRLIIPSSQGSLFQRHSFLQQGQ